ncbi:glycerol-3-phosphate acyltransferase [bacterium BMS3Abin05]|nr:glycerol-3-phosphate acyltransferase [bacterium BMS3Abin05]GBE27461.1 glycerol-3-phosphate acyltransferase [bacterium BMS3Bbin03]
MLTLLAIVVLSYLIGSFPTSIIFGKIFKGIDIRDYGSGNAGGTNAFRVMGWKIGISVMMIDVAKGLIATVLISQIRIDPISVAPVYLQIIAGFSAVIGHIWTIFAGFRGGKGVGTAAGMLIGLYPIAFIFVFIVFLLVLVTTRYVSVSSMTAAASLPLFLLILDYFGRAYKPQLMVLSLIIVLLIIFTHRSNIKRLFAGNENRVRFGKKK